MKIVNNTKDYNKEFLRCKRDREPFVVVKKYIKYAEINFDMWNADYNLTSKAVEQINNLFEKIADKISDTSKRKIFTWYLGAVTGGMQKIPIKIAEEALLELDKIVCNTDNWEPLKLDFRV